MSAGGAHKLSGAPLRVASDRRITVRPVRVQGFNCEPNQRSCGWGPKTIGARTFGIAAFFRSIAASIVGFGPLFFRQANTIASDSSSTTGMRTGCKQTTHECTEGDAARGRSGGHGREMFAHR